MSYNLRLVSYLSFAVALLGIFFLQQPNERQNQISNYTPNVLAGSSGGGGFFAQNVTWKQTNFTGGSNNGPYTFAWGGIDGWNSYSSVTGATVNSSGITFTPASNQEFESSIYDTGSNSRVGSMETTPIGGAGISYSIRGSNDPNGVKSANWGYCGTNYRYIQYRLTNLPVNMGSSNSTISSVTLNRQLTQIYGIVSGSNNPRLNGATVTITSSNSANYTSTVNADGIYFITFNFDPNATSYNVTLSKSGYASQTKIINASAPGPACNFTLSLDFNLAWVGGSTTTTPKPNPTPVTTRTDTVNTATLPNEFIENGSKTTDFKKITDPKNVPNLIIEVSKKNRISYKDSLDLSGAGTSVILSNLDRYVKMDKVGVVEVDSRTAAFLNKRATITMSNLSFPSTPKVLVDGKDDHSVVSNINYKGGTLTFDVSHFTKFEAVANSATTTVTKTPNNTNVLLGVGLLILAISVPSVYFVIEKSRKKQ